MLLNDMPHFKHNYVSSPEVANVLLRESTKKELTIIGHGSSSPRYNLSDPDQSSVVESLTLIDTHIVSLDHPPPRVTSCMLSGKITLYLGDDCEFLEHLTSLTITTSATRSVVMTVNECARGLRTLCLCKIGDMPLRIMTEFLRNTTVQYLSVSHLQRMDCNYLIQAAMENDHLLSFMVDDVERLPQQLITSRRKLIIQGRMAVDSALRHAGVDPDSSHIILNFMVNV